MRCMGSGGLVTGPWTEFSVLALEFPWMRCGPPGQLLPQRLLLSVATTNWAGTMFRVQILTTTPCHKYYAHLHFTENERAAQRTSSPHRTDTFQGFFPPVKSTCGEEGILQQLTVPFLVQKCLEHFKQASALYWSQARNSLIYQVFPKFWQVLNKPFTCPQIKNCRAHFLPSCVKWNEKNGSYCDCHFFEAEGPLLRYTYCLYFHFTFSGGGALARDCSSSASSRVKSPVAGWQGGCLRDGWHIPEPDPRSRDSGQAGVSFCWSFSNVFVSFGCKTERWEGFEDKWVPEASYPQKCLGRSWTMTGKGGWIRSLFPKLEWVQWYLFILVVQRPLPSSSTTQSKSSFSILFQSFGLQVKQSLVGAHGHLTPQQHLQSPQVSANSIL